MKWLVTARTAGRALSAPTPAAIPSGVAGVPDGRRHEPGRALPTQPERHRPAGAPSWTPRSPPPAPGDAARMAPAPAKHQPGRGRHGRHRPDRPRPAADRHRHAGNRACMPRPTADDRCIRETFMGIEVARFQPGARGGDRVRPQRTAMKAMRKSIELRKACCGDAQDGAALAHAGWRTAWITGLRREQSGARAEVAFDEARWPRFAKVQPMPTGPGPRSGPTSRSSWRPVQPF